jgi:hypothetical protein
VDGARVCLPRGLFRVFCELADARVFGDSPERQVTKWNIQRLRKALNAESDCPKLGESLICAASKMNYVMATDPSAVAVDASFRVVLLTHCVEKSVAERLLTLCQRDIGHA